MVRRDPALLLAELAWRWSFALTALAALLFTFRDAQVLLRLNLDSSFFSADGRTIEELMDFARQALPSVLHILSVALPMLLIVWTGVATTGRGLITRRLLKQGVEEDAVAATWTPSQWAALGALHAARAVLVVVLVTAYLLLTAASATFASEYPSRAWIAGTALVAIFFPLLIAWSALNWLLSLAVIFAVSKGQAIAEAFSASVEFARRNSKECLSLAGNNALFRSASALGFGFAGVLLLLSARLLPGWLLVAVSAALTLAYCVVSDWLLLTRWAGYVSLAGVELFVPRPAQPEAATNLAD